MAFGSKICTLFFLIQVYLVLSFYLLRFSYNYCLYMYLYKLESNKLILKLAISHSQESESGKISDDRCILCVIIYLIGQLRSRNDT